MKDTISCLFCGYTSNIKENFEHEVCLMCLRLHDNDYERY